MRRLALLMLLSLSVHAEEHVVVPTEVHCFKMETLVKQLTQQFGEEPIVIGKSELDPGSLVAVYVNQQTGTYTIVQTGSGIGCILDTGESVRYRMPKSLDSKML